MEITPYPLDPNYGVTRDGRVFRIVAYYRGRPVPFELKQRSDKDGYRLASTFKVHRLVAQTFIPNPEGHAWVAHEDGVNHHNHEDNLSWKTVSANHQDKQRHGTQPKGEQTSQAKMTAEMVREVRKRADMGESHASIAEDTPVDRSVVSRAIRRETWAHV